MKAILLIVLLFISVINFAQADTSCTCNGLAGNFPGYSLFCNQVLIQQFPWGDAGTDTAAAACEQSLKQHETEPSSISVGSPDPVVGSQFTMNLSCEGEYDPAPLTQQAEGSVTLQVTVRNSILSYLGSVQFGAGNSQNVIPVSNTFPIAVFGHTIDGHPRIQTEQLTPTESGETIMAVLAMDNGGDYKDIGPGLAYGVLISEGIEANQGLPGIMMIPKYELNCWVQ